MTIFFYLFAGLVLISSIMVVVSRNPVYSVLWLIFAFCNSSGLMILLGAEFLAMMLIVIYVGAVAVLFLFIVMMLDVDIKGEITSLKGKILPIFLALILLADLLLIIFLSTKKITAQGFIISNEVSNTIDIGSKLYTDFILPFQTAGIILFVAMIASISLTLRTRNQNIKRQNPLEQLRRNKANGLLVINVPQKQGIENINYDE